MKKQYRIVITSSAEKTLKRLPEQDQVKIVGEIRRLEFDPKPYGVRKMAGFEAVFRIRVGDYRIIYEIEDRRIIITILKIGHRKDVYR
jgi:mRNA interferase RelE/StbE